MDTIDNLGGKYKSYLYDLHDNQAITLFLNNVLSDMDPLLTSRQLTALHDVLQTAVKNYSISSDEKLYHDIDYHELNSNLMAQFLEDKRLQGLSERTLEQYKTTINFVFDFIGKGADSITADDVRMFFDWRVETAKVSMTTLDNYRRNLNSFYNYCVANGLLYKNPLLKIDRIKRKKKIKQVFSPEELVYLREAIDNLRDKAIFELLLSSGMRVGELCSLDWKDLDMNNCTVIVHGKGNKEREVFFNDLAKISIQRYLDSRHDDNPALFVTLNYPYNRFGVEGVETRMRQLGKKAKVSRVHPHKFRSSFATGLIRKGVDINQVKELLGHVNIETTQMYIVDDKDEIQYNHRRYVN